MILSKRRINRKYNKSRRLKGGAANASSSDAITEAISKFGILINKIDIDIDTFKSKAISLRDEGKRDLALNKMRQIMKLREKKSSIENQMTQLKRILKAEEQKKKNYCEIYRNR